MSAPPTTRTDPMRVGDVPSRLPVALESPEDFPHITNTLALCHRRLQPNAHSRHSRDPTERYSPPIAIRRQFDRTERRGNCPAMCSDQEAHFVKSNKRLHLRPMLQTRPDT